MANKMPRRRGVVTIYVVVLVTALTMFASLGVDFGRVELAKTSLQNVADSAARAAAAGLNTSSAQAVHDGIVAAGLNYCDGTPVVLQASDIDIGIWNTTTHQFTVAAAFDTPNAVRIRAQRIASRGTAVQTPFAAILGRKTCEVHATSIAMFIRPLNINSTIPGTASPFLAGMPNGSVTSLHNPHNNPDYAPTASPVAITGIPIIPGTAFTFNTINGNVSHDPTLATYSPDGDLKDIGSNTNGSENGISDAVAPINALMGVFLTDEQPNLSSAPTRLDFSTAMSRDFSTLKPQLKQTFFIGDGVDSKGNPQNIIVPAGATRFYLATWDFYEWNNNQGSRITNVTRPGQVVLVK